MISTRALIVYRVDKNDASNIGVFNKLRGQVDGLKNNSCTVDFICHDQKYIYLNNKIIYKRNNLVPFTIFKWRFHNFLKSDKIRSYDLYIVRYGLSTPSFIKWLIYLRRKPGNRIIIVDMPTFPYDLEWQGLIGKMVLKLDGLYKIKLYHYVDFILHSGVEKSIYNVPTIKFSNGINTDLIPIRKPQQGDKIHFLALAKWREWHGLDRLLQGLRLYLDEGGSQVMLDILGDGPYKETLERLSNHLKLENIVTFHGMKVGHELNTLFDVASLGIGTLGLHRKKVLLDSSLKHREFVARGLPFVMSGKDIDINNGASFVYQVKADDSFINVNELLDYINQMEKEKDLLTDMRLFAESKLSWKVKTLEVLKTIGIEEA